MLAAALAFSNTDAHHAWDRAGELVDKCTPRNPGTTASRRAANFIAEAARAAGAKPQLDRFRASTPVGERTFTNVSAEWEVSPGGPWVVVVSHFDTKPGTRCPGANDGASTTGLLIALSRVLTRSPPPGNVALMWLDGEESMRAYTDDDGLWGSRRAAARLAESRRAVKAVICVDMLGDRDLTISIPRNATPRLRAVAHLASAAAGIECPVLDIHELVKDDHMPFLARGFPAIDLIDFEYGSEPGLNDYWHTEYDTMDKVSALSLESAGSLVCEMIEILHSGACERGLRKIEAKDFTETSRKGKRQ